MLDDALSVADKYVDKYLPDKDPGEDVTDKPSKDFFIEKERYKKGDPGAIVFGKYTDHSYNIIICAYSEPIYARLLIIVTSYIIVPIYAKCRQYIELLLPTSGTEPSSQAVKTIRHVNHFSRKLQRRLTRRTIAEAKLLKKQGYDTVQCFVYFADLVSTYLLYTHP